MFLKRNEVLPYYVKYATLGTNDPKTFHFMLGDSFVL